MTDGPLFPPDPSGGPIGANPSFFDLVRRSRPETLPSTRATSDVAAPHGTTVVALKFDSGVVFGGDRRATEGFSIADETMEKVFAADDFSVIAIAGAAGQAIEIVKLFQLELEHYEKITGDRLSLEGKANRLAQMIRGNLPMAIQGLVVVPLFTEHRILSQVAGHDLPVLKGLPPLVLSEQDIDELVSALDDVIAKAGRPTRVAGLALRAARAR